MIRYLIAAALVLFATLAFAQSDTAKCVTVTVSSATVEDLPALIRDAECFGKTAASASTSQVAHLAKAGELIKFMPAPARKPAPAPVPVPSTPVTQPMMVTPIASNFNTKPLDVPGYGIPKSMAPDVVGAFRFICSPGQLNYDDPILYPGAKGGSPHLHLWYGNTGGNYASTYVSLRGAGDSTCSNQLNRSAYWIPALMNAAGEVIVPDYMSIYYKRRADGDAECLRMAAKGCTGIPTGLRVVSGYDMKRMGQAQPENMSFHFRCISPGKPSDHRGTLAEAVTDCGGAGQIMAAINFGSCWNGQLDSADHRSHLTHTGYGDWGYEKCPATHPYVIPELTQGIAFTIVQGDGAIAFSSDLMPGMVMTGGSTFHADYMEGWDPPTRDTWTRECVGKMRDCSDGELGDGTMLKRGVLPVLASPRVMAAPLR
jgi:hypothetical protein